MAFVCELGQPYLFIGTDINLIVIQVYHISAQGNERQDKTKIYQPGVCVNVVVFLYKIQLIFLSEFAGDRNERNQISSSHRIL